MKKFVLIHSYSDFNKGDAGIVISTVQNLRKTYPGCKVDMISTFSSKDNVFEREHKEISKYADNMYTSLFPELFLNFFGKRLGGTVAKIIAMVLFSFKAVLNILTIKMFRTPLFVNTDEKKAFNAVAEADVVISKGGSFLCSFGTLREDFSLWRMCYPFKIAKLYSKKTVVLAQSLGPFDSERSKLIFTKALNNIDAIYFREHKSPALLEAQGIHIPKEKQKFCPDTAFSIDASEGKSIVEPCKDTMNVGMTIVDFPFENSEKRENYKASMTAAILLVVEKFNGHVYIFPQVINTTQFGNEDLKLAEEIYSNLNIEIQANVSLVKGSYKATDLVKTYGLMNFFIATRLHSSIFSVSQNVPIINISYHGTKSEGTFELFDYLDYVIRITEITPSLLLNKTELLIQNSDDIKKQLSYNLVSVRSSITKAFSELA
tara:strand:- start:33 stop:1328 length:1296 start_codon:yes stop_codon:yes gene_type:complete